MKPRKMNAIFLLDGVFRSLVIRFNTSSFRYWFSSHNFPLSLFAKTKVRVFPTAQKMKFSIKDFVEKKT